MSTPSTMRAVIAEAGKLVVANRPVPVPAESEVLVKIHATAINRADTLQRMGKYPVPKGVTDILGLEMSGVVVGNGSRWKDGDRVMGLLSGGGYAEYTTIDEQLLMKIPENLSLENAAGIPETWLTAFQLLHLVGKVQEGDRVVVHAAGSGVGTAATQLAVSAGAKVVATASSKEKLDTSLSLGASLGLNYKESAWDEQLKASDIGAADLVLDPVGGSYSAANINALDVDGRWVLYGLMGGPTPTPPDAFLALLLRKRLNLTATTLRSRSLSYRRSLVSDFISSSLPKLADGSFKPVFDKRTFTLEEAQAAHEYMETNANIGKIILKVV
eukprot:TRINITY_DN38180_c0_g1_i1.p1 TRINITY_DN38180_c0_g1~~TRINITY_DN38180_c0_g1_i1.p1  ORF type:complete len:329 (+),score=93.15 TRINITY_DN38180_c0_g1_i1:55-1041(+)